MNILLHKNFIKSFKKFSLNIQSKFYKKLKIFSENQFHYSLNNHALKGNLKGLRSINITGDIRVHYKETKNGVIFLDIDNHSELY